MEDLKQRKMSAKWALTALNVGFVGISDKELVTYFLDENNPTLMPQQKANGAKACLDALREYFEQEANA